ncbi:MAG TPA: DNA-processing protein DprA [Gemmatimonadales bacterium]|nr:DNA-processing protein DprA [Gemmatimonadales bacterium]
MVGSRAAYVALALTPGIGAARLATLLEACGTPDGALAAPFEFLCSLPGMSRAAATAIRERTAADGRRVLEWIEERGAHCLLPADPGFPPTLREIPEPPAVLFALGDLDLLRRPAVAVVGSRDHTPYGAEVARRIGAAAARGGIVVVSGMARGLDAVAHTAALDAGGSTIGVLGNGFGVIYPAANRALYERVAAEGLLLTEFPPGERPHVAHFPRRNRLISGLARVTIVVEAATGSGALITVDTALAQGRDVLAVPGPITSPTSVGTNRLIRDGAGPYLGPEDLQAHYPEVADLADAEPGPGQSGATAADLDEAERRVVAALERGRRQHIDLLAASLGMPVAELLAVLSGLEIRGLVVQAPAGCFARA